jgi:hypothetical protein
MPDQFMNCWREVHSPLEKGEVPQARGLSVEVGEPKG